LYTERTNLLDI